MHVPIRPVRTSSPPMISGISISEACSSASLALSDVFSGEPGAYDLIGSLTGWGTRNAPFIGTSRRHAHL